MADKKNQSPVKLNKKHQGKEFNSFYHFVGKIKQAEKWDNELNQPVKQKFYVEDETYSGKPFRMLQFAVETAKDNDLDVRLKGYKNDYAYLYNSSTGESQSIKWDDRFDKSKYPNESFHLMETDWDKIERLNSLIVEGNWVEVKGEYEFGTFHNQEKGEINWRKRKIKDVEPVENGQDITVGKDKKVLMANYVTDFKDENFKEFNHVNMQIGINSVLEQKEDDPTQGVLVNAYFLDYGKEKSTPRKTQLKVDYNKPNEGKISLAEAFLKLERLDFLEVEGTDNNRPIFGNVEVGADKEEEDDPFEDLDEDEFSTKERKAITGTDKGVKIETFVKGSRIKNFLTEEEVTPPKPKNEGKDNPFDNNNEEDKDNKDSEDQDENPFNGGLDEEDPFA